MNSQVYLNPVKLSILSIRRDRVWLFSSSILKLLHEASEKKSDNYDLDSDTGLSDSESEDFELSLESSSDEDEVDFINASHFSNGSGSKRNLGTKLNDSSKFDNSSKPDPLTLSYESITDLMSLLKQQESEFSNEEYDEEDDFFFHVAYTPTECTIICATLAIRRYFDEPLAACKHLGYDDVVMLPESYLTLQIDTEGDFNNSERILELTRPLSAHKISLFFLSSHFTDIVLIPFHLKEQVVRILTKNNFEFSDVSKSYVINRELSYDSLNSPDTPGESANDLENNTLKLFQEAHIKPKIEKKVRLLLTGARPGEVKHSIVKAAQCISAGNVPDYFAITRTSLNEISLILPGSSRKRSAMGFDYRSIIGSALDTIIPISIDLTNLPLDATGIVAGLASRILTGIKSIPEAMDTFEMSYLSMARSALLMIPRENFTVVSKMIKSLKTPNSTDVRKSLADFLL